MKRQLLKTSAFIRSANKVIKRDRALAAAVQSALEQLTDDAFHPTLKTHKLKGNLSGS